MGVYTFSASGDFDQLGFQYAVNKIEQITISGAPAKHCTLCKYYESGSNGVVRNNYVAFEGDYSNLTGLVSIIKYDWDGNSYVQGQTYTGTYNASYDSVTDVTIVYGSVGTGASMWGAIPPTTADCYTTDINENMYRLAREYFDTPQTRYKLVIKGRDGNAEFPAEVSADYPRLTLYDDTYIPLVEDDGSAGPTLKVRLDDKVYRIKGEAQEMWEVWWQWRFESISGQMMVRAGFVGDAKNTIFETLDGILAKYEANGQTPVFSAFSAKKNLVATTGNVSAIQTPFISYSAGADLPDGPTSGYDYFVIAKEKLSTKMPFEIGFHWQYGQSMQGCVITKDGVFYGWVSPYTPTGVYLKIQPYGIETVTKFQGEVRVYKAATKTWVTFDPSESLINQRIDGAFLAFAIPQKTPEYIFKDGQFDGVVDGFEIGQYKEYVDNTGAVSGWSNLSQWFGTKWGLWMRQQNGGQFVISSGKIRKQYIDPAYCGSYYAIPLKQRLTGAARIQFKATLSSKYQSGTYNFIYVYGAKINGNALDVDNRYRIENDYITEGVEYDTATYIDGIDAVDYIILDGAHGVVDYNDIKISTSDVKRKSDTAVNVIFQDGQWGDGVMTNFDFTGKDYTKQSSDNINDYAKPWFFSKYLLRLHSVYQTNYPFVINGNNIYHGDDGYNGGDNLSNIYIPIKRAYGYTKLKVKMGQLAVTGASVYNYVACVPCYVNSNRALTTIRDKTVFSTVGVNEYELDISNVGYCDYIVLGCSNGTCVWQSITLE